MNASNLNNRLQRNLNLHFYDSANIYQSPFTEHSGDLINNFVDDFANDLILIKFSMDSIDQLSQNKGEKPPQNTRYLLDLESVEAPGNITALLSV